MMNVRLMDLTKQLSKDLPVYLTGHVHPDGDCIGAVLALSQILTNLSYRVTILLEKKIATYSYLPFFDDIKDYSFFEQKKNEIFSTHYNLVVLDSGDLSRIEPMIELYERACVTVNIDHHESNSMFAQINILDKKASSTCELLGVLIGLIENDVQYLTKDIASCLYTGIIYDTGVFKHTNTRKETHLIASQLVHLGIDFNYMIQHLYFSRSLTSMAALKLAINRFEFIEASQSGITCISYTDMTENHLEKSDTEMIVSMLNEIIETKNSVFFLEVRPEEFKVSFRSSSEMNVCAVAQIFSGGGHIKAAGCTILGNFSYVKDVVLKELQVEYKRYY